MFESRTHCKLFNAACGIGILIMLTAGAVFLSGCGVVHKVFDYKKEVSKDESTTHVEQQSKTEKIQTESGEVHIHFGDSLPCANIFHYNAHTGAVQASGNVKGVSIQSKKEAQEKAQTTVKYRNTHKHTKDIITKHKQTTKVKVPLWLYIALVLFVALHFRKPLLNLVKKVVPVPIP